MPAYAAIYAVAREMRERLAAWPELAEMFAPCYLNTLETTTELLPDGTTFVFTGDIHGMWLRDSAAQVMPYAALARNDADVRRLIGGLIRRQARYIAIDAYANAFNRNPSSPGNSGDTPRPDPWVWERKFELDSLCYPLKLCQAYWDATRDPAAFGDEVHAMVWTILRLMRVEQDHDRASPYTFERAQPWAPFDTLPGGGRGTPTRWTGMVWSGFRPSDDACTFGYLIPANMFAAVALTYAAYLATEVLHDTPLAREATALRNEIESGIQTYGMIEHPRHGQIYAYETDGFGHSLAMDDANVPSLLSTPYLGYRRPTDPIYQNTRRFALSTDNPYYFAGREARGIGSPHTPAGYVWPLALAMRGLTTHDPAEQMDALRMLAASTAGTRLLHESFDPDRPHAFTRPWFAWANSLGAELMLHAAVLNAGGSGSGLQAPYGEPGCGTRGAADS
jgi:meiotically up-regulated gene 157 (Mug157) protein